LPVTALGLGTGSNKGGADAGVGRIVLCLSVGGLAFCLSRTGESSVASGLGEAGALRRVDGRRWPGTGRINRVVAGHDARVKQRRSGAGRRAGSSACVGAEEENGLGRT